MYEKLIGCPSGRLLCWSTPTASWRLGTDFITTFGANSSTPRRWVVAEVMCWLTAFDWRWRGQMLQWESIRACTLRVFLSSGSRLLTFSLRRTLSLCSPCSAKKSMRCPYSGLTGCLQSMKRSSSQTVCKSAGYKVFQCLSSGIFSRERTGLDQPMWSRPRTTLTWCGRATPISLSSRAGGSSQISVVCDTIAQDGWHEDNDPDWGWAKGQGGRMIFKRLANPSQHTYLISNTIQ